MASRICVLNFHGVGTPPRSLSPGEQRVWIDAERFNDILDQVRGRPDLELTFDDANESDALIALPALQARGMKARFFVLAGRIGQAGSLSAEQIKTLRDAGMSIGTHGMHHRRWTELSGRELHEEIFDARKQLQQLTGLPIDEASCPFGSYNRHVLGSLRRAGYQRVYTSDGGSADSGAWLMPRYSVARDDDVESIKAILSRTPTAAAGIWRRARLFLKRWR